MTMMMTLRTWKVVSQSCCAASLCFCFLARPVLGLAPAPAASAASATSLASRFLVSSLSNTFFRAEDSATNLVILCGTTGTSA